MSPSSRAASSALASRSSHGSAPKERTGELATVVIQGKPSQVSDQGATILPVALEVKVYPGANGEPTATLVASSDVDPEQKSVAREGSSSAGRDRLRRNPARRSPLLAQKVEESEPSETQAESVVATDPSKVTESPASDARGSEVVFNSIRELSAADPLIALAEDLASKEPAEMPKVTVDELETVEHVHSHASPSPRASLDPEMSSRRDGSPVVIDPSAEEAATEEPPSRDRLAKPQAEAEDWAVPSYLRHRQDDKPLAPTQSGAQGGTPAQPRPAHSHALSALQTPTPRRRAGWLPNPLKPLRHLFGQGGQTGFSER